MTMMTSWDLFEDLRDAQDQLLRMNRGRSQALRAAYDGGSSAPAWAPAVDICERKDAYLVTAELPGVGLDELDITIENGLLTIEGERHVRPDSSEEQVHRVERRYGPFRRSITLPTHVLADAVQASVEDGVLAILVPKAQEVQAKRIAVRVGGGHAAPIAGPATETVGASS